jgi:hypothetical protein
MNKDYAPTTFARKAREAERLYKNNSLIDPWWITGFTDAEGSFQIVIREDTRQKINWRVSPAFQIKLHIKDICYIRRN